MTGAVLYVHPSDEGYGADRVLLEMVAGSVAAGRAVKVLLPDDSPPGWLSTRLHELGVPVKKGPLAVARRRYLKPSILPRYVVRIIKARRFVRREAIGMGAAIVHINTTAVIVGALIGHPGGARTVWYVLEIVLQPRLLAWLFRVLPRAGDKVVVTSKAVQRHLGIGDADVVYNAIEDAPPVAAPELSWLTSPVVAYVGRLSAWKGYLVFLEAALALAPRFPRTTFVIAGSPPPGEEWRSRDLADRIRASGGDGEPAVNFLGFIENANALLEISDIAVVPSVSPDPMPTVVLQAMLAGCAVVGSNHGGIPEMIEHESSGLLVTPGDSHDLASAIARLLEDEGLRMHLGQAAKQRVETHFTADRFREEMEAIHQRLER